MKTDGITCQHGCLWEEIHLLIPSCIKPCFSQYVLVTTPSELPQLPALSKGTKTLQNVKGQQHKVKLCSLGSTDLLFWSKHIVRISGIPMGGGGGVWGFQTPPKFHTFDKGEPNSQFRGKYIHNNLIRIRVSLICKLSGTPTATAPRVPFSLPSILNWICWTPCSRKKFLV
jgi:hypothetical protein